MLLGKNLVYTQAIDQKTYILINHLHSLLLPSCNNSSLEPVHSSHHKKDLGLNGDDDADGDRVGAGDSNGQQPTTCILQSPQRECGVCPPCQALLVC